MGDPTFDFLDELEDGVTPEVVDPSITKTAVDLGQNSFDLGHDDLGESPKDELKAPPPKKSGFDLGDDSSASDLDDFMASVGLQHSRRRIEKPWMKYHKFVHVKTIEEVQAIVDEAIAVGRTALDLETEGLDNRIYYKDNGAPFTVHQIVGYCLSPGDATAGYYIPVRHAPSDEGPNLNLPVAQVEAEITRLCKAAQPQKIQDGTCELSGKVEVPGKVIIDFWHASFDQEFLYPVTGIDFWHPESFEDGYLAAFVVYSDADSFGLKENAKKYLKDPEGNPYEMIQLKELFQPKQKIDFKSLSPDEPNVVPYAASDAICTRLLCAHPELLGAIEKQRSGSTYRLEKLVSQVKRVLERNRVKVDKAKIDEIRKQVEADFADVKRKIRELAQSRGFPNFEPGSTKQLSEFLFSERGLNITPKPEINEKSKQYKTDSKTLHELIEAQGENAPPILTWIEEFRSHEKLLGTYLEGLFNNSDRFSEMRFGFNQTGAATGRFSAPSGDPEHGFSGVPIHGIPDILRGCFVARDSFVLGKLDYAGQELRVVTNLSGESVWTKEFLEGDGDLHSITARAFFGKAEVTKDERKQGKCVIPSTLVIVNGVLQPLRNIANLPVIRKDSFLKVEGGRVFDGHSERDLAAVYFGGKMQVTTVVSTTGSLTCSVNHLFELETGEFVRAEDLRQGMILATPSEVLLEDRSKPPIIGADPYYLAGRRGLSEFINNSVQDWIMRDGPRDITAFLAGLFDVYGNVENGRFYIQFRDLPMLGQVATCLTACGFRFTIEAAVDIPSNRRPQSHGSRSPVLHPNTFNLVLRPGSAARLRTHMQSQPDIPTELVNDKRARSLVLATVPQEKPKRCYDLSVNSNKHVYWANGFITHNTANFALIYGGGPAAIQRATGCNRQEGVRRKQNFDRAVPTFAQWVKRQHASVKKDKGVRNAFGRWIAIPDADLKVGDTHNGRELTNSPTDQELINVIRASCERKATNYPVQSSGADIMKIAMVLIHRKLHEKRWLKNGGDDSVRMLLTVHDELVFEIRPDRVLEVLPILIDLMEYPSTLARWKVPLVVDPILGKTWASDDKSFAAGEAVSCHKYHEGKPFKGVRVGDLVFPKGLPDWLAQIIGQGSETTAAVTSPTTLVADQALVADQVSAPKVKDEPPSKVVPKAEPLPITTVGNVPVLLLPECDYDTPHKGQSITIRLTNGTQRSALGMVRSLCERYSVPGGAKLTLVDADTGATIIDEALGIEVDPSGLARAMAKFHRSDGKFGVQ